MRNPNTTKAYDYLRKRILSGEMQPGAFLSAQSLSKDIGVSRTPVREALRQLECDDLVTIVPKLGAVIKTLNKDQFQDLLGYRQALEVHSAGRAAELRRPEEVEQLRAVLDDMKAQTDILMQNPKDAEALRMLGDYDIRFHRMLFAMARNTFIRERFERAHILQRMVTLSIFEPAALTDDAMKKNIMTVFEEHVIIFEAIRDGDENKARNGMIRHLSNFAAKASRLGPSTAHEALPQGSAEVIF